MPPGPRAVDSSASSGSPRAGGGAWGSRSTRSREVSGQESLSPDSVMCTSRAAAPLAASFARARQPSSIRASCSAMACKAAPSLALVSARLLPTSSKR
eukprot:988328-Pyramimonas_sp.AAC.1